jgi:predicted nucleotide-binding protein (sugar kinase/HSP70/actin superfamily)
MKLQQKYGLHFKPPIVKDTVDDVRNQIYKSPFKKLLKNKSSEEEVTKRLEQIAKREKIVIGIPRLLNMYSHTPFFTAYFEALGIKPGNFVFSEFTSEEMYKAGAKRGSIDPCFPSKVAIPIFIILFTFSIKRKN